MNKNTGREYTVTSFRNGGRRAGDGMLHDNYDDESCRPMRCGGVRVRMPHDDIDPEELNGPVRIIQKAKK